MDLPCYPENLGSSCEEIVSSVVGTRTGSAVTRASMAAFWLKTCHLSSPAKTGGSLNWEIQTLVDVQWLTDTIPASVNDSGRGGERNGTRETEETVMTILGEFDDLLEATNERTLTRRHVAHAAMDPEAIDALTTMCSIRANALGSIRAKVGVTRSITASSYPSGPGIKGDRTVLSGYGKQIIISRRSIPSPPQDLHRPVPAHTGSGDPPTINDVNDKILREFNRPIFTVDLTAQGSPCGLTQTTFRRLTYETLFGDDKSTKDVPRLPACGFKAASKSYESLSHLLNIIVHASNICMTRARYLKHIRFDLHGVEMRERLDSEKPLKPVILGLLHSCTPDKPKISWNDVAVFIEVKSRLSDVIEQLTKYARCHLEDEDGFRGVVEHMVGILSIKDEEAFGLDMTRVENVYRLNDRNYEICTLDLYVVHPAQTIGSRNNPAGPQSRELTLIDKTEGRTSEGTLFSRFFGQFGIIDVAGFHTCSREDIFGSTAHYFSNARFLALADDSPVGTPEIRQLHCTAMALEGHYNLFLGGVLHRDVSSGNILRLREPIDRSPSLSISLLCLSGQDVKLCRGLLFDGDHAIEWCTDAITPSLE
ncbi:hypothetical protein EDB87DRAFT_1574178 [Lactarius vividus]|nr:hypothetical protein EDB87DRAFT_1574178 [Lactarius vividus]